MTLAKAPAAELSYQDYQDRQYFETRIEALEARARKMAVGGRARYESGKWIPQSYPGFALQAMVNSSPDNNPIAIDLSQIQRRAISLVERPGVLYPLPQASFHQTVANTFSSDRLQRHVIAPGLHRDFPSLIKAALSELPEPEEASPPAMRLIGLSIFRTAFGLLGVFPERRHFERITGFRDRFYGHPRLAEIGLTRTRPFIGHITLGYIEDAMTQEESSGFVEGLAELNKEISRNPLRFYLPKAELRRYDTLAAFIPEPDFPSHRL